jgi:hypothetical protein
MHCVSDLILWQFIIAVQSGLEIEFGLCDNFKQKLNGFK